MTDRNRRGFLKSVVGTAAVAGLAGSAATRSAAAADPVDRRVFGRTGAEVSILGLGLGSAFTNGVGKDEAERQAVLQRALDLGVNFWDTAAGYGPSQEMIGPMVGANRDKIYLVSKSAQRSYEGFMRELENSLRLLKTDHIDLYHCHNLGSQKAEKEGGVAACEGAVKAALKAKADGKIGHWGVTGHSGAGILVEFIKAYDPDALLSVYPADGRGKEYETDLLPLARERNLGVVAMKTVRQARQSDLKGSDLPRYAMSLEGVHVAIVGLAKLSELDENAKMASGFTPLSEQQMASMAEAVKIATAGLTAPWETPGYTDCHVV